MNGRLHFPVGRFSSQSGTSWSSKLFRLHRPSRIATSVVLGAALSLFSLLGSGTARGDWVGGSNSDWNTAANWTGGSFPAGDAIINNTAGPGVFPVISANSAFTPVDVRIGTAGGIGRVDQRAGTAGTGNGNWMFLGYVGSNATYNLANTAGSRRHLTGFAQGSGSLNVGGTSQNGNFLVGLDNATDSTVNVNTTGTLTAGGIFLGAAGGSNGHFNMDSGTVNLSGEFQVGANFFSQGSGTNNTFKMSGGTVTADIFSLARGTNNAAAMTGTATHHWWNAEYQAVVHVGICWKRLRHFDREQQRRNDQRQHEHGRARRLGDGRL